MRRRYRRLVLLGAAVYLLALGVQMPAAWALHWVRGGIPESLSWTEVEGSVWGPTFRGLRIALAEDRAFTLERVRLELRGLPLLAGRAIWDLRARAFGGRGRGQVGLALDGSWRLERLRGSARLQRMPGVSEWGPVGPLSGSVTYSAKGWTGQPVPREGRFRARVEGLASGRKGKARALGDYRLEGRFRESGRFAGDLRTERAVGLGLEGTFRGDLDSGRLRFEGEGWSPAEAGPTLREILPVSQGDGDARAAIEWSGRLR